MITPTLTTATLIKKELLDEELGYFTFKLENTISFKAGQFISLKDDKDNDKRFHSFSLTNKNSDETKEIELFIRKKGEFTTKLFKSAIGSEFKMITPTGNYHLENNDKEKIFIAGGAGIAPLIGMIKTLYEQKKEKLTGKLFYSSRFEQELAFKKELKNIEKNSEFKTILTITREQPKNWGGELGHIDKRMITKYIDKIDEKEYYICGPPPFVEAIKETLTNLKVNINNIKIEEW